MGWSSSPSPFVPPTPGIHRSAPPCRGPCHPQNHPAYEPVDRARPGAAVPTRESRASPARDAVTMSGFLV